MPLSGEPALVVLDFDGTLAETREAVSATINAVLAAEGSPRVQPAFLHGLMGLPLETLFHRAIPPFRRPFDTAPLVAAYRASFAEIGLPRVRPRRDAEPALDALAARGHALAIATSRERSSLDAILARFGWHGRFAVVGTCDDVAAGKPAPDLLLDVLRRAGRPPTDAVMVGDTTYDLEMAAAAGVAGVGVEGGSHDRRRLEAAPAAQVLPDLHALVGWLAGEASA